MLVYECLCRKNMYEYGERIVVRSNNEYNTHTHPHTLFTPPVYKHWQLLRKFKSWRAYSGEIVNLANVEKQYLTSCNACSQP
jgi:hypothetical protein